VQSHDFHVVMAGITADNVVSLRLHQRLGFVEVAHMPQVSYKFGKWLDLKFLQLVLDGSAAPAEA